MGLLKQLLSRTRSKEPPPAAAVYDYRSYGRDPTKQLPNGVLELIFSYVCPHSQDYTYDSSEESQIGEGCMLCDLRDLSHCVKVCKRWARLGLPLLFTSIRIDAVHFCELEEELAYKRKKAAKHFKNKVDPGDIPGMRLDLLCQTLRNNQHLARHTQYLKLPYMTRESCKAEIARIVSALPNLRYVDLPDGFYTGDSNCHALREELQAQCPMIGKMVYRAGSERYLDFLVHERWKHLEVLELDGIAVEPSYLQLVLGKLSHLRDLKLKAMPWLDDDFFDTKISAHSPLLQELSFVDTPNITAAGLQQYFRIQFNDMLVALTLQNTGVLLTELHALLSKARSLQYLSVTENVSKSINDVPLLASSSLRTLTFEVTDAGSVHGFQQPSESFYAYLASSLHGNALPALEVLYVRDQVFPERMLTPPPRTNAQSTFNQRLEIFSRGIDEIEWVVTAVTPQPHNRPVSSKGRPISVYSASRGLGPQWAHGGFGGEARKSVIVGNGFGGYLAVPASEVPSSLAEDAGAGASDDREYLKPPPSMSALTGSPKLNEKRASKHDLWR